MVEPDPNAVALAREMMGRDDIMRSILSESIESAESGQPREAGRTYCESWGSILKPTRSDSNSIDLQTCVSGGVGVWHTHPGSVGLTQPVNSLPDMANAVFGHVDASVVPGTKTADVVVAPANPDRAQQEFRQAIGADVRSAADVRGAINARRVAPARSRDRAREVLSGLVTTVDTGFSDLSTPAPLTGTSPEGAADQAVCACATRDSRSPPDGPSECLSEMEADFNQAADDLDGQIDNLEIGSIAISAAVGNVVGEVVNRVLFD